MTITNKTARKVAAVQSIRCDYRLGTQLEDQSCTLRGLRFAVVVCQVFIAISRDFFYIYICVCVCVCDVTVAAV